MPLTLRLHDEELCVCRLAPDVPVPAEILARPFAAFLRAHDEATLVCPADKAPRHVKTEAGFIALELVGPFDFALTGILTQVADPLAAAGVSIFALSTFSTDYVLVKAEKREAAAIALRQAGHVIHENRS